MSVMWTNELTETLIDLYHTHSVLWDTSDVDFKNKNKKRNALKTISDIMGLHELEIQRKIKNLTAQFFRERKKIKEDNKCGAISDTPRWFAYQRLLFLTNRKNKPRLCGKRDLNETNDSGPERSTRTEISQNQSPLAYDVNDTTVQPPPDPQPPDLQPGSTKPYIRKNIKVSKRKISNYYQRQEEAYSLLRKLQTKKSRNRFAIFGEHVATKIEALKSSYAQNVVEHLISNILFEASIGKYDYPSDSQLTPFSTHSSNSSFSIHAIKSPQYSTSPSPQQE